MYEIVIVDDEPFILDGLKKAIDWEGYHFEIACAVTSPQKALNYIKNNKVHLLITDISMPEMNGIELIKQAKKTNPLLSILVLSAYDDFEYVRSALRYGAENYLLKPLDTDELSDSVKQIISHMQEREQLSNAYGLNMLTFRSNFIEHWVKNIFSKDDLKTRADLLGINLNAENYTVVIFSSIDNNGQRMSQFFDFLLSFLLGNFIGHFYFETPYQLVSILSSLESDVKSITSFIKDISKSSALMEFPVFISAGNTVHHYSEVGNSCQNASTLLFLKYTYFKNFHYEAVYTPENVIKQINQSFTSIDLSVYLLSIEKLFSNQLSKGTAVLYTITAVSWCLQQLGRELENTFSKFPQILEKLKLFPYSDSISEYKGYTVSFAKECYELLTNCQQSMYPCVDAVIKTIHEFADKDVSLKTLATKLNVSPSYLGNIFRQQTGYYFNDYLTEARLKYATSLIENTDMKIKDIVDKVGFSSQTYFNRIFKRYYNISPLNYRRKIRVNHISE